ncbi:hypothetical protein TGRH88_068590 [Toxoplasma gondii]|uniref:Uncharacterized protein n=1 Tax=Toxoplasma gondii TaxID=5811 RepID=A0A7J6K2I9_TOXGO|nr:hypothetical protein TGRH88_068590 [Toxoplasma gondii]
MQIKTPTADRKAENHNASRYWGGINQILHAPECVYGWLGLYALNCVFQEQAPKDYLSLMLFSEGARLLGRPLKKFLGVLGALAVMVLQKSEQV